MEELVIHSYSSLLRLHHMREIEASQNRLIQKIKQISSLDDARPKRFSGASPEWWR